MFLTTLLSRFAFSYLGICSFSACDFMATLPIDISQVVQIAAQAAQAAAQAATALQRFTDRRDSSGKFSEAGKVVRQADPYGTDDIEQDIAKWTEFYDNFRAWLFYADKEYEVSLDHLENNTATPVDMSTMDLGQQERSKQLYSILIGSLRGRPLRILKGVAGRNGFEAWRQLLSQYQPRTRARSISMLSALMNFPQFNKSQTIIEQIQGFERLRNEYRRSSGVDLADDVSLSILVRCLPKALQQHVQLQLKEDSTYNSVRSMVVAYEQTTSSWTDKRIYSEVGIALGSVGSYGNPGGATPMEIDALQQWKGKGKGDKGKGKGKGKFDFGKGKSKGKGKSDSKGKGLGKNQNPNSSVVCHYCGKQGHMKKECFKFQRDQNGQKGGGKGKYGNAVRQVQIDEVPEGSSNSEAASSSSGPPSKSAVRLVERVFDLTAIPETSSSGAIRVVSSFHEMNSSSFMHEPCSNFCKSYAGRCTCDFKQFDLTCSDSDGIWTNSPWLQDDLTSHVRMLNDDSQGLDDIVLDSGADVSALPLCYSGVGTEIHHDGSLFVDAQGNALHVDSTRLAKVQFGDVTFKEKFIVSGVTTPLLSLGNIMRSGWSIHNDGTSQWLTKDDMWIPLFLKRNSLCAKGFIQLIQDADSAASTVSTQVIRAVSLSGPLMNLRPGWNRLSQFFYAIMTKSPTYVDSTMAPAPRLLWYRTTLIKVNGAWEVAEFRANLETLDDLERGMVRTDITDVLTLAHDYVADLAALGISDPRASSGGASSSSSTRRQPRVPSLQPLADLHDEPLRESSDAPGVPESAEPVAPADGDVAMDGVPAASGEAEALVEDRPELDEPFSVVVDGVALNSSFPLATIRDACTSLGLGRSGGKMKCLERLKKHLESQQLAAQHSAEIQLRKDDQRVAQAPPVPTEPSDEERNRHNLTHQPYASWCEVCVANRGRQDGHRAHPEPSSGASVVSFDFGYLSRLETEDDPKLTALFVRDQHTKLVHAVPTPAKGGRYLKYLTTELCRFIVYTQHTSVTLRTDDEPSTLALLECTRKSLSSLGITCNVELAPVGSHQSNGAAEKTVHLVRQLANCFMQQLETNGGAAAPVFKSLHPVTAWSLVHAAWIRNKFVVQEGQTAFERAFDRVYNGRICSFGEVVLAFVKTAKKGAPSWRKGVWLTKSNTSDVHVVGIGEHIVCTRSVRRLPKQWDLKLAGDVVAEPRCFGLASLGSKLVSTKHILPPQPLTYAVANQGTPDEAASDPPDSPRGALAFPVMIPDEVTLDELARRAPVSGQQDEAGIATQGQSTSSAPAVVVPVDAAMQEPPLSRGPEDDTRESSDRAAKAPRLDAPDQQMMQISHPFGSLKQVLEVEHEDEPNTTYFEDEEVDNLELYDDQLVDFDYTKSLDFEPDQVDPSLDEMISKLCKPFSTQEPSVSSDELSQLDALADKVEILRLKGLGVLLPTSTLPPGGVKKLTTRFVRTWRDKFIGDTRYWLRRSRYVAREFSWLSPDRQDLFSPASSSITNRLLPYCYLHRFSTDSSQVLAALDIGDAFLTVDQQQPTIVTCELASGDIEEFALGKVLPGQRDGSLLWYQALTSFLAEHLHMESFPLYPCLLKSPDCQCLMLLHVDDILVVCSQSFLYNVLLKVLKTKYKVSAEAIRDVGDSITFLKRNIVLESQLKLVMYPHPKHFDKLFELMGVKKTWKPKHTPAHAQVLEVIESPELGAQQSSTYRSAVGILLYLSCDMVQCQWMIRHLAQSMSKPTLKAWTELRHLVQYLLGCTEYGLMMHYRSDFDGSDFLLKTFTDSDWASNKGTRKSVSACCLMMNNCLLSSGSRNQGLIALSSAEAETYAATSGACDALFLSRCLEYLLEVTIGIKLLIDNSACRYILSRAGCGRVRHLSTRILWMQQRVERKELMVGPVASTENVSDIGTKRLSVSTMKYLMYKLGVYDSETSTLVGHEEFQMKTSKQNLRLITGTSNFKMQAHLIRLIVANSLVSSDALGCGTEDPAMEMSWTYLFGMDGVAMILLKPVYMQLCFFLEELYAYITVVGSWMKPFITVFAFMHQVAYVAGWIFIIVLATCLLCRMVFGKEAIDSTPGRVFVLLGDVLQCMLHQPLTWYGERQIKFWHQERQRFYDLKDKQGITYAQNMAIGWREYLRVLQAIVHNMFEEHPESADDKHFRYKNMEMSECSDPDYWHWVHYGCGMADLSDEDFVGDYITNREALLKRARDALEYAYIHGDHERMYHYENVINTLTMI